jgi:hypothetical protein
MGFNRSSGMGIVSMIQVAMVQVAFPQGWPHHKPGNRTHYSGTTDMTKSLRQSASHLQQDHLPLAQIAAVAQRARENAPVSMRLPDGFEQAPPVLAMGSRVRSAFCMLQSGKAVLSQQMGDLRTSIALQAYQRTLSLYLSLLTHSPVAIAIEQHPEYPAAQLGKALAQHLNGWMDQSLPLHNIQYHHAHVAACMVDNQIPLNTDPVLGIALGGLLSLIHI